VDALADAGVPAPDRFPFRRDDEFAALLRRAGFDDVEVRPVSFTHRVADTDELWDGLLGGSVRSASIVMSQPVSSRARVREAFERRADQHRAATGLTIPVAAKIALGRKP
jgi:hypothetical protein